MRAADGSVGVVVVVEVGEGGILASMGINFYNTDSDMM